MSDTTELFATLRTQMQDANKPGLAGVRAILEQAIQKGHRDEDYSALFESINPID